MIPIGTYIDREPEPLTVVSDDVELRPHLNKPWMKEWLDKELGTADAPRALPSGPAMIDPKFLARHSLIVGKSGFGKSRFATHLAMEQVKEGCSLVFLDPKDQTVIEVLAAVQRAGVRAERITVGLPTYGSPPPWNPIDARALGVSAEQAAKTFVDVLKAIYGDSPRMMDILSNTVMLAAAHGLSLFEVLELMRTPEYLEGLLKKEPLPGLLDEETFYELDTFFKREWPVLTKNGSLEAVMPAINKIREPLRSSYLRGMFCARRPSFNIASLWREPKVLLLNLHPKALAQGGAKFLGGLIIEQLMDAAMREGGKGGNPVVLFLDEIAFSQDFLGEGVGEMIGMARSYDLRFVAACQYLDKIKPELRADLLSVSVKAFFRLTEKDAAMVADQASLSSGDSTPKTVKLSVASRRSLDTESDMEKFLYPVCDPNRKVLALKLAAFEVVKELPPVQQIKGLEKLMSHSGLPPLACIVYGGRRYEIARLLEGVPENHWGLAGPDPMYLLIRFPRPKISTSGRDGAAERERIWRHRLINQEGREMVLISPMCPTPREVEVAHVPDPEPDDSFLDAVLLRGQSDEEVRESMAWRRNVTVGCRMVLSHFW